VVNQRLMGRWCQFCALIYLKGTEEGQVRYAGESERRRDWN
jgi:hypothetical protein